MKAGSFDIDTCKECLGDDRVRRIEKRARDDAESGIECSEDKKHVMTYWDGVVKEFEAIVYVYAYYKRKNRLERMNAG
jgi:hypothetical protein